MFRANASLVDLQYDSLDPLSLGNGDANYQRNTMGEWDSVCDVRGYGGFRSFKVRPKKLSRHGRQYVRYDNEEEPLFNMSNVSRLKSQSIRHSTAACRGDEREPVWTITADMMERTQVVLNEKEEQVAFVQKSLKTLILNAQFGKGSEVVIDIAPGVDQFGTLADAPVVARAGCSLGLCWHAPWFGMPFGTRYPLCARAGPWWRPCTSAPLCRLSDIPWTSAIDIVSCPFGFLCHRPRPLSSVFPSFSLPTALLAVLFAEKQVGSHVVKDGVSNFVINPLQNEATDQAVEALGMGEAVNAYNSVSSGAAHYARVGQWVQKSFFS